MIECSICIATYKRPELLAKLLDSLKSQELPDDLLYEIILVDNDSSGSAGIIADKYKNIFNQSLKYFVQPVKNISSTRNLAVEKALGKYLLFIDDDEVADPKWIAALIHTVNKFNADAAFGRVISYFDEGTPEWIKTCFIYNREAPETGTTALFTRSGNCIVKSELLSKVEGPFDIKYGITGGSDTHLFDLLRKKGAKYINCREAVTYEYVPPERAKPDWIRKRAFRVGNSYTRRTIEVANRRKKIFIILEHSVKAITFSLISLILAVILIPDRKSSMHWRLKFLANLGKIYAVFGLSPQEYN